LLVVFGSFYVFICFGGQTLIGRVALSGYLSRCALRAYWTCGCSRNKHLSLYQCILSVLFTEYHMEPLRYVGEYLTVLALASSSKCVT